ncbi:MAG TPA: winged helix-turn-helix domain-containing protein [Chloroflexota bacterium]|nr:winged helix-turn-helix domain-containing protein [Chloroflexota bacterium]
MAHGGERVQLVTLYTRVLLELIENPRISQEVLARRLDVTMRTAQRHLTELEAEDYISVDRTKKPFEYSINWGKAWPYVPWMRVILLRPELRETLQTLSDGALRTLQFASSAGEDPGAALRAAYPSTSEGAGVA